MLKLNKNVSMRKKLLYIVVFSSFIFFNDKSYSKEIKSEIPVFTIYTNEIPGLINKNLTGEFVEINNEIAKRAKLKLILKIVPAGILRKSFHHHIYDIAFPMLVSSFDKAFSYYRSSAFYQKRDFIFNLKGKPLISSILELEKSNGIIGLTLGYSYNKALLNNAKLSFSYSPGDNENMLMLNLGVINSLIVEEHSGIHAAKQTNVHSIVQYDPTAPLFVEDVFYAFQKKASLIVVRDAINKAINEMKEDGTIEKIRKKYQSKK